MRVTIIQTVIVQTVIVIEADGQKQPAEPIRVPPLSLPFVPVLPAPEPQDEQRQIVAQ